MYASKELKIPWDREIITLNKGDYGDVLRFTIKQPDDSVKDLTGWGGRLVAMSSQSGSTYMVSGAIALISGTSGTCSYAVASGDTDTGGRFPAHLILTSGAVIVSIGGWEVHVVPYGEASSLTEYCTVDDITSDMNAYRLLRLEDYRPEDIRRKIQFHSANINKKIGTQSASDLVISQLCKYMVLVDIASGLPTAEADGERRTSLLGVVAKWENWIRETLADYDYGVPDPVFTEP